MLYLLNFQTLVPAAQLQGIESFYQTKIALSLLTVCVLLGVLELGSALQVFTQLGVVLGSGEWDKRNHLGLVGRNWRLILLAVSFDLLSENFDPLGMPYC